MGGRENGQKGVYWHKKNKSQGLRRHQDRYNAKEKKRHHKKNRSSKKSSEKKKKKKKF